MASKLRKKAINQNSAGRKGNNFRDEFYRDGKHKKSAKGSASRRADGRSRGKKKLSGWVYVATSGIVLCIIAIAGSSAVIWLRNLGGLFGVTWLGD